MCWLRSCTSLWRRSLPDPSRMGRVSGYICGRFTIGSSDFFSFSEDASPPLILESCSPLTSLTAGPSDLELLCGLPRTPASQRSGPIYSQIPRPFCRDLAGSGGLRRHRLVQLRCRPIDLLCTHCMNQ